MGKTEKEEKREEKKEKRKIFKYLVIIFIVVYVISFSISMFFLREKEEKIEYTAFLQQVQEGKIEEITINTGSGKVFYTIDDKDYYSYYPYTDTFIENMLLTGMDIKYASNKSLASILPTISSGLMILVAVIIGVSILREVKGGSSDMGKTVDTTALQTTFADIAGMDEIKEDMRSLAELIKNKEYKEKGVVIPKGVLLDGPPGNGKTLLARAFAGECGLNFIALNASDFESIYVGASGGKIRKTFDEAKKLAPCVIFIDEIDAIGSKRTSARSGAEKEFNSILTTLLGRMDGFTASDDILVMAATNRASDLDEALVRPGRFDRKFTIGYPDKKTRQDLFTLYTKNVKISEDVSVDNFVSQTYGCSSSKIKGIINEAIISSITNKRDEVNNEDFSKAIIRMTLNGVEKKKDRWEGKTKEVVAYHEAGHAVIAHVLGKTVSNISIIPTTANAGGYTLIDGEEEELASLSDYKNSIKILYGGRAAEAILSNDVQNISTGASGDIREATRLASSIANFADGIDYSSFGNPGTRIIAEKTKECLNNLWEETLSLAKENWEKIVKTAEELKIKEKISEEEFKELLK